MNDRVPDVHQTLEYRIDTAIVRGLPTGLALCFLSLLVFALDDRPPAKIIFCACVVGAAGLGLIGFALWRRSHPGKPLFVLSPMGVHCRMLGLKDILVPWREIEGVDKVDITRWNWSLRNPGTMTFHDVTVVLVSKQFYDAHIFVDSFFRRGPAWSQVFIPKGSLVQIALHHEAVSVEPRALREAAKARWHAFRNQPPARVTSVPVTRFPLPKGVPMGSPPRAMPAWETVLIVIPMIGIAVVLSNLGGLWATEGQTKAREERRKFQEWDAQMQASREKLDEQLKKSREELDRTWREFNSRRF